MLRCWAVTISTEEGGSGKINVMVVCGKSLVFDLLSGIDAMKALGGIAVELTVLIWIGDGQVTKCVAISINEPDFTTIFDHQSRVWTTVWKRSDYE